MKNIFKKILKNFIKDFSGPIFSVLLLLLLSLIIFKLLGYTYSDLYYKNEIYCLIAITLELLYQVFILFLLHVFSKKDVKIAKVLPDFVIRRLEGYKSLASSESGFSFMKNFIYTHLCIYAALFIALLFMIL